MTEAAHDEPPFYLGCPVWSVPAWKGLIYPGDAKPADFLGHYSRSFATVEGNSTFYALPHLETARKWASAVDPTFRFCFKVPRDISHGPGLGRVEAETGAFRAFLEIFAEGGVLGPSFLQLHASFGPERFDELMRFVRCWPKALPLAVEVRHFDFFEQDEWARRLSGELEELGVGRVLFDSRALFHSPPDDAVERVSQSRKPRSPVRWDLAGSRPFLRFVGRNEVAKADPWLREAAVEAACWIGEGKRPFLFMHAPEDAYAPALCQRFHGWLREERPELPPLKLEPSGPGQMELF